jgi:hypothetical protein
LLEYTDQELQEICQPLIERLVEERIAIVLLDSGLALLPCNGAIPEDIYALMDAHHPELMRYMTFKMRILNDFVEQAAKSSQRIN